VIPALRGKQCGIVRLSNVGGQLPGVAAGQWRMQARDFANAHFRTLDQINVDTVKRLGVGWTRAASESVLQPGAAAQ
jgi:glucose dehydrogenase